MFRKNNSYGFTIVELLAIIVVLGVVIGIAVPSVNAIINRSKSESYDNQVEYIERAAKNYVDDNDISLETNEEYVVQMTALCNNGYLKCPIDNPLNGEALNGYVLVTFTSNDYHYYFVDLTTGATTGSAPAILLNGLNYVTLTIGDTFTDLVSAYDAEDGDISNIDIVYKDGEGNVIESIDTLIEDTYTIVYTVEDLDGNITIKERTVVVVNSYDDPNVSFVIAAVPSSYQSTVDVTLTNNDGFDSYYKWSNSVANPTDGWVEFTDNPETFNTSSIGVVTGTWYLHIKTVDPLGASHYAVSDGILVDGIAPVITLTGDETLYIINGDSYSELGATAVDGYDPSPNLVTDSSAVNTSVSDSYLVYYTATDNKGNESTETRTVVVFDDVYNFAYTGDYQIFTAPAPGYYKFELNGAAGSGVSYQGLGAYTSGELYLDEGNTLYVYVGECVVYDDTANKTAFNGGGAGGLMTYNNTYKGEGGGATDVRLVSGTWDDFDSLKSRIMVAAGGGGQGNYSAQGGDGGLSIGGMGLEGRYSSSYVYPEGTPYGGTQSSAGTRGGFGYGGVGQEQRVSGAGGGGGYFGGSGGNGEVAASAGGGGGSSFISGVWWSNAIAESSTSGSITFTNQPNHYSGYVFEKVSATAGQNSGAGSAIVTYVEPERILASPYEFEYDGTVQEFVVPETGTYQIELWGAGVGNPDGGRGSYTKGTIDLMIGDVLYLYLGESGKTGTFGEATTSTVGLGALATFNGGGAGGNAGGGSYPYESYRGGSSGGGATDIRLVYGVWDDVTSLRSRIMVAAGGGGTVHNDHFDDENGEAGGISSYQGAVDDYIITRETQFGVCIPARGDIATSTTGASFGAGGTGANSGAAGACHGHSGGGGGYFGGYGAESTASYCFIMGGAGGSSFISGHTGCNAVSSSTGTSTGSANHDSGYIFTNTVMIDGAGYNWTTTKGSLVNMPDPDGGTMVGNIGNGFARITLLE